MPKKIKLPAIYLKVDEPSDRDLEKCIPRKKKEWLELS